MSALKYRMTGNRRLTRVRGFLGEQWMLLEPREYVQSHICNLGVWEPHVSAWLTGQLRPGSVFVDVGANIGYYTLMGARLVGRHGRVVAIEPVTPGTVRKQVRLNRWNNVEVCAVAAGNRSGTLEMGIASELNRGHSSAVDLTRFGQTMAVDLVRLDDLLAGLGMERVDLMKIDVEGYEVEVFQGAHSMLASARGPNLVFELSPGFLAAAGHSAVELKQLLAALGYTLFHIADTSTPQTPGFELRPLDPAQPEVDQIDVVALKSNTLPGAPH